MDNKNNEINKNYEKFKKDELWIINFTDVFKNIINNYWINNQKNDFDFWKNHFLLSNYL